MEAFSWYVERWHVFVNMVDDLRQICVIWTLKQEKVHLMNGFFSVFSILEKEDGQ